MFHPFNFFRTTINPACIQLYQQLNKENLRIWSLVLAVLMREEVSSGSSTHARDPCFLSSLYFCWWVWIWKCVQPPPSSSWILTRIHISIMNKVMFLSYKCHILPFRSLPLLVIVSLYFYLLESYSITLLCPDSTSISYWMIQSIDLQLYHSVAFECVI